MLINSVDRKDLTMRFRRAPQGIVARFFDWAGVITLSVSVLSLIVYWVSGTMTIEGTSLRVCLTCLNLSIIFFVAARVVELADRVLQMSSRDHQ